MMPGPLIDVCKGDTIVVDVENELMGESTTIHWHGLHQRESMCKCISPLSFNFFSFSFNFKFILLLLIAPYFDGVPQITQCPILSQSTFRYEFKASNVGTHWWHSHTGTQRKISINYFIYLYFIY